MNRYQRTPNSEASLTNALKRLINPNNAAEGPTLPPPQFGPFRVPFVSNLAAVNPIISGGTATFTIIFSEPPDPQGFIGFYNIYVFGINGLKNSQLMFTTMRSPITISFGFTTPSAVTFTVQTVLKSGLSSTITASPTTTGQT